MLIILATVVGFAGKTFEYVGGHLYDATSLGNYEFGYVLPGTEGEYGLIEID